ncbi:MAG TPA: hypothetical protein DD413_04150 [Ruminococcus sp.]|nr:hypothetical protein [Ruminococcus sp.]
MRRGLSYFAKTVQRSLIQTKGAALNAELRDKTFVPFGIESAEGFFSFENTLNCEGINDMGKA